MRVSVDDDADAARKALAGALLPYVIGWPGAPPARPFRAAFERMGFGADLAEIDQLLDRGATREQVIEAFPEQMLRGLGYYGPASGAMEAVQRLAAGADTIVVRLVPSGPGLEPIRAILDACQPAGGSG